ncbi:MAG: hypothetical protein NVS2B3_19030 [Vulcanimicrobiaceae bacterium]
MADQQAAAKALIAAQRASAQALHDKVVALHPEGKEKLEAAHDRLQVAFDRYDSDVCGVIPTNT